jgi:ribosome biogenesis protein MAK21
MTKTTTTKKLIQKPTSKKPKPQTASKSSLKRQRKKEKEVQKQESVIAHLQKAKEIYLKKEKEQVQKLKTDSKQKMIWQAISKGTVHDKVRAFSVLIQENPWFCLGFLNQLSRLIHNKNNKTKLLINQEIKELFKGPLKELLEESKPFVELQSQGKYKDAPEKMYIISVMRHHLKKLLNSVNDNLRENLSFFKSEYIEILAELARALDSKCVDCYDILISKVADSESRVGSTAAKYVTLGIMYQAQSALTIVQRMHLKILNTGVDNVLAYLICLANVDYGKVEDKNVLYKALEIFLQTCQKNLEMLEKNKNMHKQDVLEKTSTIVRQVTRGINRLLPHIKNFRTVSEFFQKYMNSFFKMAHIMPNRTKIQILIFIFQIAKGDMYSDLSERFMTLLYSTLRTEELMTCSLSEKYFDLLFSALSEDYHQARLLGFMKRMFTTGIHCSSQVILTILVFFAKLIKEKPILKNLLSFKQNAKNAPKKMLQVKSKKWENVEDGVEVVSTGKKTEGGGQSNMIEEEKPEEESGKNESNFNSDEYNPLKRNPKYCNGDKTALWELVYLSEHYNYLVRKFARMVLNNKAEEINYKGNPMIDFSRGSIINRLILRNIKHVR